MGPDKIDLRSERTDHVGGPFSWQNIIGVTAL